MAKLSLIPRLALACGLALALSACATVPPTDNAAPVTRALAAGAEPLSTPDIAPQVALVRVSDIEVVVPRSLKVSERNSFYPGGDIVWHGDPIGDRYQQVADVVLAGLTKGVEGLDGPRAVKLFVEVTRFHALTPKTRYTFGGVHAIQFYLTVFDAETGEALTERRFVKADFDGLGGQAAIAAEARGITQKVRITDHLAKVIQDELTSPEGYHAEDLGLIGALNQI